MYNSNDFERLFIRYKGVAYPKGESIQTFCNKNKIPYNLLEKYFKTQSRGLDAYLWVEYNEISIDIAI